MSAKFLTLAQVAERVATPAVTVRYWVHTGKLKAFKPGRQVLVREADLEALIEASAYGAVREAKAKAKRKARAA